MSDYQPTDEQIEALARFQNGLLPDTDVFTEELRGASDLAASSAFQAIIRAAQAEALRTFSVDLGSVVNPPVDHKAIFWVQNQLLAESDRIEAADV